ncbi:polysaccharide biosynthesis protein [Alkalicoccobacillus porphyridii]|uniref:Polysaccharide biosynthesis protein n=1 Tax=Alkalicoccobacillus porphyridii TaxID=2597270 RepID=A0A554A4F1_9BACI|nr:nucleoside-diphosphate sugar epimerase/dehydratase [Alkalicoccobacillus porphyridii]TSB48574.1 polysaccharide biosynthesis protein [Alkalicoccobacillus porphyridii]
MGMKQRLLMLISVDSAIVLFSIFICNFILSAGHSPLTEVLIVSSIVLLLVHHLCAYRFRLYKRAWEYASVTELKSIVYAVTISIIATALVQIAVFQVFYVRTLIMTWMMHVILIGGSRMSWRLYKDTYMTNKKAGKRTLIIGAGSAGAMIARQLKQDQDTTLMPIGFIDDNFTKHGLEIMNIPILGGTKSIKEMVSLHKVEHIVIAIPSLIKTDLNRIVKLCTDTKVKTQILPRLEDLVLGSVEVSQFKDVEVEDLLGREPVELDVDGIAEYITGETILVTGAGGSIGSEICRQVARFSPKQLILLGHGENSIYSIEMELRRTLPDLSIDTEIADIQDKEKMHLVMRKHQPHVIFHAAAHKHVPLMERNPEEAVKNNVMGTRNVAEAADAAGVNTFVMISSDKAVNPTSVMGSTKRIAEMVVQHMDMVSNTRFVAVRFGNVLGSRGSVIPLFKDQIINGGPVTVTHPDMVRYFMTIPEASRLVLQAGSLAEGGEVFVLDMGEPVKIAELAKNLIRLSGYNEEEIPVVFTGMRPGEKMFEELLGEDEVHSEQVYPMIYRGKTPEVDINVTYNLIERFQGNSQEDLRQGLLDIANFKVRTSRALNAVK